MISSQISPIFAYLPNGIIREIVSYTGATYKKRNGKYMGQIPKEDTRYTLLCTIPPIGTLYHNENPSFNFNCNVDLTRKPHFEGQTKIFYEIVGYHHDDEDKILYTLTMYGNLSFDHREYEYKEIIHPNANSVRLQLEKVSLELGTVRLELDTIGERMKRYKRRILFDKNIVICCTMFLVGNLLYMYRG